MADHIIDLTLPAHDLTFPKPRGLLPVPPEVTEYLARDEAEFIRKYGTYCTPEARQRILDNAVLNWYYDNHYIAYRRTPEGVEVLAVGVHEVDKYFENHPESALEGVVAKTI
jgi:hypothetical protein